MSKRDWWVLRIIPSAEITAEKLMKRLDYEAMCPYEEKQVRRGKSRHPRPWKIPLYPGYLFVRGPDWRTLWHHVNGKVKDRELDNIAVIYGYLHPIWTTMPYFLPPADVEYLQSISDGKYKPEKHEALRLKVGDKVLIPDGPFHGYEGPIQEISGKNATIEVEIEKKTRKIKTKLAKLKKCE